MNASLIMESFDIESGLVRFVKVGMVREEQWWI